MIEVKQHYVLMVCRFDCQVKSRFNAMCNIPHGAELARSLIIILYLSNHNKLNDNLMCTHLSHAVNFFPKYYTCKIHRPTIMGQGQELNPVWL